MENKKDINLADCITAAGELFKSFTKNISLDEIYKDTDIKLTPSADAYIKQFILDSMRICAIWLPEDGTVLADKAKLVAETVATKYKDDLEMAPIISRLFPYYFKEFATVPNDEFIKNFIVFIETYKEIQDKYYEL